MPNWCNNTLRITGTTKNVVEFKQKAVGHSPWEKPSDAQPEILNFHSLVPVPEKVLKQGYVDTGYNWERENWGCRSGASDTQIIEEWDGCVVYAFDTPWSPPLPFISHLSKSWPQLTFILDYEEFGMCFKGLAKAQGGHLEDHCIET